MKMCTRCDNTDSSHNIQGIRRRQDDPVNSQPRGFMRNRNLRQLHFKDSHDTSILRIISKKMSRSRSHSAKSGRILEIGLKGVQMPSYSGQSAQVSGRRQEVQSSDPVFGKANDAIYPMSTRQTVHKDSDQLITRPQAAKYNGSAKSNYTAKYSYRAKHNYKVQFSPEESRSRPYLPRQVKLNAFGTELSSDESARQSDGSTTPFSSGKGVLPSPGVSRPLPRARPDDMSPKGACAIVLREQTHSCAVYRTARVKARWSRLAEGFIVNVDGSSTSFLVSTPNELRLHHRESTVTQCTKETPLDVPSCPQESASLTSAHSLAHQELRSIETGSTGPAPKEERQPPTRSRRTLSILYALSPPFSASLASLITHHLSSLSQSVFQPAAMQEGCSLPSLLPVPIH
ncbi:hypothetical protein B9Z55_014275 [Caenorhabditis nigoni]|uniref:Uncharacterized protein n=1 Tax=Caenorhabditis nigoni TaxID=1611254 RepID=A0A2G5U593_9PELO|nr:hypothetical protein B9Z55_014275 [Caenorhabditis nigoni]